MAIRHYSNRLCSKSSNATSKLIKFWYTHLFQNWREATVFYVALARVHDKQTVFLKLSHNSPGKSHITHGYFKARQVLFYISIESCNSIHYCPTALTFAITQKKLKSATYSSDFHPRRRLTFSLWPTSHIDLNLIRCNRNNTNSTKLQRNHSLLQKTHWRWRRLERDAARLKIH